MQTESQWHSMSARTWPFHGGPLKYSIDVELSQSGWPSAAKVILDSGYASVAAALRLRRRPIGPAVHRPVTSSGKAAGGGTGTT